MLSPICCEPVVMATDAEMTDDHVSRGAHDVQRIDCHSHHRDGPRFRSGMLRNPDWEVAEIEGSNGGSHATGSTTGGCPGRLTIARDSRSLPPVRSEYRTSIGPSVRLKDRGCGHGGCRMHAVIRPRVWKIEDFDATAVSADPPKRRGRRSERRAKGTGGTGGSPEQAPGQSGASSRTFVPRVSPPRLPQRSSLPFALRPCCPEFFFSS